MKITVQYSAQARVAAGRSSETVELPDSETIRDLVVRLGRQHGEAMRRLLLKADGSPHPSLLVFVADEQVRPDEQRALRSGEVVSIMTPISGG
jgi:molybdopterin converting factor small subunit